MGKGKGKTPARKAPRIAVGLQIQDAPLAGLSRDQLSAFLFVALTPEETRTIVKERKLSIPGFRSGSLGDVERCDVIADEIRANPPAARSVLDALVKAFERPPFPSTVLGTEGANDLLDVGGGDAALALSLWRVLSDRSAEVRGVALPFLDELAAHYFGSGEAGEAPPVREGASVDDPAAQVVALVAEVAKLETRLREAEQAGEARTEEVRLRGEEQREKLQGALREARARESRAVEESARAQEAAAGARQEAARARTEADALRASDAALDAHRARAELRDLGGKLGALEARLERAREREQELAVELDRARAERAPRPAPEAGPAVQEEPEAGEADTWLMPVYTREFYDSIDGWDRRILRAAFKQAHLLAQDHRHPSLRAIPLEGLPGYYRVRVATDVRLIYRRAERQNTVEILSLIDREDLDRYVRQAKTRG
jgi:mRNA-degrading endonuclease RelE of RelBE toxin-antitoxin system